MQGKESCQNITEITWRINVSSYRIFYSTNAILFILVEKLKVKLHCFSLCIFHNFRLQFIYLSIQMFGIPTEIIHFNSNLYKGTAEVHECHSRRKSFRCQNKVNLRPHDLKYKLCRKMSYLHVFPVENTPPFPTQHTV